MIVLARAGALSQIIERNFSGDEAVRLKVFAERLFAREPHDRIDHSPPDHYLSALKAAYEFLRHRSEPIAVSVTLRADDSGVTVIETSMRDCPFIVDSLLAYFHELGAPVLSMLHPVFKIARDTEGTIVSFEQASSIEQGESLTYSELELPASAADAERIAAEVRAVLVEVRQATGDFDAMVARALEICEETAAQRALVEVRDFLRWLVQGGFVFLGYRHYDLSGEGAGAKFSVEAGSELGIMRDHDESRFRGAGLLDDIEPARRKLFFDGPALVIGKTRAESRVHRRAPMDSVTIRRTNPAGRVMGFDHFVGLLTSKAYTEEAQHIPTLRAKLHAVLEAEGAAAGSHDYKELVSAFNSFPKDELFRAPVSELRAQLHLILDVKNEATVRLCVLSDPYRGIVIAMVVMPREAFSASVRQSIQAALAAGLGGTLIYYYLAMGEGYTARLHFCFSAQPPKAQKIKQLESEIARLAHRWEERLTERLIERFGAARGRALGARWAHAFSDEYRAAVPARRAILDLERIEDLLRTGSAFHVELNRDPAADDNPDELRILGVGEPPILSELMPMLQNFGIKVLAEEVHHFQPQGDGRAANAYVQAFSVAGPDGQPLRKSAGAGTIADAIAAARAGNAEDDPLGALVVSAGLKWREAALLRAYLEAAFQMRLAPARPALLRVLLGNPRLARTMFELFAARLDPDREDPAAAAALRAAYLDQLGAIDNIADDRAARMLLSMVEATVRTNFFCPTPEPDPYLALKFESAKIMGLPDTAPLYEIHVNSPRMVGCHLRAGKVARGGIRFSDRPDDFRTEILGLMKTQTVKNAIIVPIGSKGGFVVKHAADPSGVEAYRTLIFALLDLTDNLGEHGVVHPPRVKVLDSDGPYLVVAADKGTAAFSDIANGIALERGFWLGDAFASGGEHGFDHKAMGITARGAWESARRHLREIGRDLDRGQPVTMIGIGDMSGDVFGNGMLRSRNLALIAAFDHRHIFVDPAPDPATSFEERRRLYELPHSSWADYNPALISKGGGVWRRGQKRIEISPEACAALGVTADALDGESLIGAILRAPVDLLYNGGIGTYVRAGDETEEHVGDHANDGCRITAAELRAKIAVEGGNLGFTQKARIEYALAGGRINTDAIDNSAGVDTSDHEVNLKILLDPEVARGAVALDDRNRILAALADEVAATVLRDNRDQALLLSLEQLRSRTRVDAFREHMQAIEERGLLRRHEEALPTREALSQRHARFAGLTRPELALITAYTKIDLVMRLEGSALTADPHLVDRMLKPYFPASIARSFDASIPNHRLRRELIATRLVNEMVDLMGSTFVFGMVRDHGVSTDAAVHGWLVASEVLAVSARAERIRAITAPAPAEAETGAFFALERAGTAATAWALRNFSPEIALDIPIGRFRPAFESLSSAFEEFLQAGERERFERIYRELRALVADGELAHDLARVAFADHLLNVLSVALARNLPPERVAEVYFGLGAHLDFSRLEAAVSSFDDEDRWRRRAAQELAVELREGRLQLTALALAAGGAAAAIEQLRSGRPRALADLERLLAEIATMQTIPMPAVHVAARAIARLTEVD